MQGKDGRRQPGAGHLQLMQYPKKQKRTSSVQKDVDQVVTQGRIAPKLVLQPKHAEDQWIILLRCAGLAPHAHQPFQRTQVRPREVLVIVPDRFSIPSRLVGEKRRGDQEQTQKPALTSRWSRKSGETVGRR